MARSARLVICSRSGSRTRSGTARASGASRRILSTSARAAGTSDGCRPPTRCRNRSARTHAEPSASAMTMSNAAPARLSTPGDDPARRMAVRARARLDRAASGAEGTPQPAGSGSVGTVSDRSAPAAGNDDGITCVRLLALAFSERARVSRPSRKLRRSAAISEALRYRWTGCGASILQMAAASPGSQEDGRGAGGSVRRIARASVALLSSLMYWWYGCTPLTISNSITPSAQRSSPARTCPSSRRSGEAYGALAHAFDVSDLSACRLLAIPRSRIRMPPSARTSTCSGFRSE